MTKCKVIALANQKGGTAKTTTTLNLGIGLVHQGRKVLLVDADPQGDLTTALGWTDADNLPITLDTQMKKILQDEPFVYNEGILHHEEGVDIIPTNIELSGMEISLVNAMSREQTLKLYLANLKKDYDCLVGRWLRQKMQSCSLMAKKLLMIMNLQRTRKTWKCRLSLLSMAALLEESSL